MNSNSKSLVIPMQEYALTWLDQQHSTVVAVLALKNNNQDLVVVFTNNFSFSEFIRNNYTGRTEVLGSVNGFKRIAIYCDAQEIINAIQSSESYHYQERE